MTIQKFILPNYHEIVFGDSNPRTSDEILLKIFGSKDTDYLETWSRLSAKDKKSTEKYFYDISTNDLTNYCKEPGWQYVYARNKHVILIEDIRKNGIKVPLLVFEKYTGGIYSVVEGHHRAGAAVFLGIKKVKCFVLKEVNK